MNTVSAPWGIGAPVKIRIAWPGWIAAIADAPAAIRPVTANALASPCGRSRLATA